MLTNLDEIDNGKYMLTKENPLNEAGMTMSKLRPPWEHKSQF